MKNENPGEPLKTGGPSGLTEPGEALEPKGPAEDIVHDITFAVLKGGKSAVLVTYPDKMSDSLDGPFLEDNSIGKYPPEPGHYQAKAVFWFNQGYYDGYPADGESDWGYTLTEIRRLSESAPPAAPAAPEAVPMVLHCPECRTRHLDVGEFATKPHHTHACQGCGFVWRPAIGPTVGVQFLPGFKNEPEAARSDAPEAVPAGGSKSQPLPPAPEEGLDLDVAGEPGYCILAREFADRRLGVPKGLLWEGMSSRQRSATEGLAHRIAASMEGKGYRIVPRASSPLGGPTKECADRGNKLAVAQTEFHRLRDLFRRLRPEIHNLSVSGWDRLGLIEAILRNRFPQPQEGKEKGII